MPEAILAEDSNDSLEVHLPGNSRFTLVLAENIQHPDHEEPKSLDDTNTTGVESTQ